MALSALVAPVSSAVPGERMVIREFLEWLQDEDPDLSQSEIARRARLSQSVINKILVKTGSPGNDASPDTYRLLAAAFSSRWAQFLKGHPDLRQQLLDQYAWAVGSHEHLVPPRPKRKKK